MPLQETCGDRHLHVVHSRPKEFADTSLPQGLPRTPWCPTQVASRHGHLESGIEGQREAGAMIEIDAERVIQKVSDHLDHGGNVQIISDEGQLLVRLVRWRFWGVSYEISHATQVAIQRLMAAKRQRIVLGRHSHCN